MKKDNIWLNVLLYLFTPEESSSDSSLPAVIRYNKLQISLEKTKSLIWIGLAIIFGLLLGQ